MRSRYWITYMEETTQRDVSVPRVVFGERRRGHFEGAEDDMGGVDSGDKLTLLACHLLRPLEFIVPFLVLPAFSLPHLQFELQAQL